MTQDGFINSGGSESVRSFRFLRSDIRVLVGFVLIWALLDRSATLLGSTSGQSGLVVCALVVVAAVLVEMLLFNQSPGRAFAALGFRSPGLRGSIVGVLLSLALLAFYPLFSWSANIRLTVRSDWIILVPGLLAQAGVAEEVVFRGYLFRHFRAERSFWQAAFVSMVPFTAVHLLLFIYLSWPIALASTLLAVIISFPIAHLFEVGRNTIWIPGLIHFVIQGSIKLVELPEQLMLPAALVWMALCASVPWLAFMVRRPQQKLALAR